MTTVGSGPPIVALHASGMTGRQFSRFAAEAKDRFRVACPDLLGMGQTPLPTSPPYSLALERDAVVSLLEQTAAASGEPAYVFAHSFGGLVALEAMTHRPELVRKLAVYEPVIVGLVHETGSAEARAQIARIASILQQPVDDDSPETGRRFVEAFVDWWNAPGFFAQLPEAQQQQHVETARHSYRQASCVAQMTLRAERLADTAVPTLFLVGETSPTSAREAAHVAARAMPQAALRVIAGAGHMGPLTHGGVVNQAVLSFFDDSSLPFVSLRQERP